MRSIFWGFGREIAVEGDNLETVWLCHQRRRVGKGPKVSLHSPNSSPNSPNLFGVIDDQGIR
jgi:hypothetical protein